jgi:hypothetical protein
MKTTCIRKTQRHYYFICASKQQTVLEFLIKFMGARNRVGNRVVVPARQATQPWRNWFLGIDIFGLLKSLKIRALTKYSVYSFLVLRSGLRKPVPVGGDGPRPPSHRPHAERKRRHIPHFRRRGHVLLPTPGQIFRTDH